MQPVVWMNYFPCGSIAQLVERLPYKQDVTGSSPVVPTRARRTQCGVVVQLVRTPACHAGGRGFKSLPRRQLAAIAQSVERILGKDEVSSSNLDSSSKKALKS